MAVDEARRHRLYESVSERLGEEEAATLMELLPPVGWADVATKHDVDASATLTKRDLDALGVRLDALEVRVDARIERLRADIEAAEVRLRGELDRRFGEVDRWFGAIDGRIGELQAAISERFDSHTWKVLAAIMSAWFASLAFVRFA